MPTRFLERGRTWGYLFWVSMVVFWSKLYLISTHASVTPFWDQWDAQGFVLYEPYLSGDLGFSLVLYPQNEHHIVITKLLSLVFLELAGTWDTLLEMIWNAGIHVTALVVFLHHSTRAFGRLATSVFLPFALILLVPPFGWENTLWGFQSQFYLMVLTTLVALGLCLDALPFSRRWWVGFGVSACAVITMASGAMVFPVLAGFTAMRVLAGGEGVRRGVSAMAMYLVVFAGAVMWIPEIPAHAVLRADSVGAFLGALEGILAWPLEGWWGVGFFWLPGLSLAWHLLRRGFPAGDRAMVLLAILAWVFLQDVSLAYGRAASPMSSRYVDVILLGVLANVCAVIVLLQRMSGHRRRFVVAVWVLGLMAGVMTGVVRRLPSAAESVRSFSELGVRQTENVRGFIETGDSAYLFGKPLMEIPFPDAGRLEACLRFPNLRGLLPAALGSTELERTRSRERTLLRGRLYGVMQRVKRLLLGGSRFLFPFSVVGFAVFSVYATRQRRSGPC